MIGTAVRARLLRCRSPRTLSGPSIHEVPTAKAFPIPRALLIARGSGAAPKRE